jgi:2'-5' RNA ligase
MARLFFFATFISNPFSEMLQSEVSCISDPALRFVDPEQYHQTFYPPFPCSDVKRLIRSVTDRFELFFSDSLLFTELSLGPYPSDLRLMWTKGEEWAFQHPYQVILTKAILEANHGSMEGVISESSLFLPHITLGRFLPGTKPLFFEPKPLSLSIPMQSLSLVETVRSASGSRYDVHAHWSLL